MSHLTAYTLLRWQRSETLALAALLAPLYDLRPSCTSSLAATHEPDAVALAQVLVQWQRQHANEQSPEPGSTQHALYLRRLYRQAYLDAPRFAFLPLLMATHHAQLLQSVDHLRYSTTLDRDRRNAQDQATETEEVFLPLAEFLGMWRLRREWVEHSQWIFALLDRDLWRKYEEFTACQQGQQHLEHQLANAMTASQDPERIYQTLPKHLKSELEARMRRWLWHKVCASSELRRQIDLQGHDQSIGLIAVQELPLRPGLALYQARRGMSKEALIHSLRLQIVCATELDCYRVLGVVHRLAQPEATHGPGLFQDCIASPKFNGYQALRSRLTYRLAGAPGSISVECRILTEAMSHLNEDGVLATVPSAQPPEATQGKAWWSQTGQQRLERILERLRREKTRQPPRPLQERASQCTVQTFLHAQEVGTTSAPLYVFTPEGEIVFLPPASSPLDLAYRVHPDLGHHAAKVEVNGQLVPYHYPLHNGDVVRIHKDPRFAGPDPAWLRCVKNPDTRNKIKRGLLDYASDIHAGRLKIIRHLLSVLERYYRQKEYEFAVTMSRLNRFLQAVAYERGFVNLEALYTAVVEQRLSEHRLVTSFLSQEFGAAILVETEAQHTHYPLDRIRFCPMCWPVPGEAIVGCEHRSGTAQHGVMVHASQCKVLQQTPSQRISVRWAETEAPPAVTLVAFEIKAESRRGLLRDIAAVVFEAGPAATLYRTEALRYGDGASDYMLVVGASWELLAAIQRRFQAIPSVHQVMTYPADTSIIPTRSLAAHLQPRINPYTLREVWNRQRFYDREEPTALILRWLTEEDTSPCLILHGQRRVGKTSLARYLKYGKLREQPVALPVFVDLQGLSDFDPSGLAQCFVQEVYRELHLAVPPPIVGNCRCCGCDVPWRTRWGV